MRPRPGDQFRLPRRGDATYPTREASPRHAQKVAEVKAGRYDLVLIGDSITHTVGEMPGSIYEPLKAVWDRHYAPRNAINFGHNGCRSCRRMNPELTDRWLNGKLRRKP